MHFFGTIGTISFLFGFIFTVKIFWDKLYWLYWLKKPIPRDITEQPIFYLALVALIVGVQLFMTGFIAELFATQSSTKRDYQVTDKAGFEEKSKTVVESV
jgi:hypothetical protein